MRDTNDSFEVPEEVLVQGVLYAMQNIDSRYIFFDTAANRFQITRSVGVPIREFKIGLLVFNVGADAG